MWGNATECRSPLTLDRMDTIDPTILAAAVAARLSLEERTQTQMAALGDSGFRAVVDGEYCLSNVHVWPDGSGLAEYLSMPSETGASQRTQLASVDEAANWAACQIRCAVVRAQERNSG
jgi:hypothetical protein